MPLLALGVSYRRATVDLLERLSFTSEEYPKAYRRLADLDSVREAVILSTCNRVEVYADIGSYHAGFLDLKRFLCGSAEVDPEEIAEPLYSHYEEDAVEHLFGVAAGIDSMVLGEPQILTQVRQAFRRAAAEGAAGPMLSAVFQAAVRTGRRARAETAIGASPAAFVQAGATLAEGVLGGLEDRSVVVIGAGGMAALAVAHLRERGVGAVRILNRSPERARRLAVRAGGQHGGLEELARALAGTDLVVSSTGAAGLIVGPEAVREARSLDHHRGPLFLLDLAVPRDIDPEVAGIPGVRLVDIDDLRGALASGGADAAREVERVRTIVATEVDRYATWRRSARLAPLIQALRDRGERVAASELARLESRLAKLPDRDREAVGALARGIVNKLLHKPIVRVKELSGQGSGDAHARALAELFGIEFDPEP